MLLKLKSLLFPSATSSSLATTTSTTSTSSTATSAGEWKELPIHPSFLHALKLFLRDELIVTPFDGQERVSRIVVQHQTSPHSLVLTDTLRDHFVSEFHTAMIEYNLRIVAKYYARIRMDRVASLLQLRTETVEFHLSDLSFRGDIAVKIDRPQGMVVFQGSKQADQVLTDWAKNISTLLELMETTGHLINRENMVYKV